MNDKPKMRDKDVQDMAQRCVEEITMLRARIAELAPKAHAYDLLAKVIGVAIKEPAQGYGEDIVGRLRKQIAELQPANSVGAEAA